MSSLAEDLVKSLSVGGKMLVAAESCTAGLAADLIAGVPGASKVFWGSFVVYTVDAKVKMLGIPRSLIEEHGEVSREIAIAMAQEALCKSEAAFAFSTTGFAGPDTGTSVLPVGTVWAGFASRTGNASLWSAAKEFHFSGARNEVRKAAALAALKEVKEIIENFLKAYEPSELVNGYCQKEP